MTGAAVQRFFKKMSQWNESLPEDLASATCQRSSRPTNTSCVIPCAFAPWWAPPRVGQPLSKDSKFTTEARRHGENKGVQSFLWLIPSV